MIRQKRFLAIYLLVVLVTLTSSSMNRVSGQVKVDSESLRLPSGNWRLTTGFCWRPECESAPVLLYSITSDVTKGAAVTTLGFHNRSSIPVAAVKLNWYLTTQEDQDSILMQGNTPLLYFPSALAADSKWVLEYMVVSFAKIYKPLLKRGVLNGNYHITVAMSEVLYENGSSWTRTRDKRTSVKAASHVSSKP
jgi:hypothetical protein